ncbi:DUF4105 domain-containing protein, partial [Sphingobacterium alkalisoli]
LIEKKIPGKGWEYIVYNGNDQTVLTQDAVQRAVGKWSYMKYDVFGRMTSTGIYTNTALTSQLLAQNAVNSHPLVNGVRPLWEDRIQAANYTNKAFPTAGTVEYTVNYYDDYTFNGATNAALLPSGITRSQRTNTLLTGTRVSKDDGTAPLLTVNYYDERARLIQAVSQNHLGGTDRVTNTYSFVGELLTSRHEHKASPTGAATTVLTTNAYDHVGRLLTSRHKINSQTEVVLAKNEYNEIGQLKNRSLHSENNGSTFLSSVAYSYNERGWTTKAVAPQFSYQLNYNTGTNPQYNGNISQQLWGHASTTSNTFSYTYDKLNRLINGTSTGVVMSEVLSYDDMGNIESLQRDNKTPIAYSYLVSGQKSNRLQSLSGGFTGTYTYDANGNATKDRTGMTFSYNYLNLPKTAVKTGVNVSYLYDALGSKLRKTSTENSITTISEYVGPIEYSKVGSAAAAIDRIATSEGYLTPSGSSYIYHYNLKDHLGNVRSVLKKGASASVPEIVQQSDYYPFGKRHGNATYLSNDNRYLYNGKELQDELRGGVHSFGSSYVQEGHYDYGARFYDAEIGRWNTVDPLAEMMRKESPYNYAFNNPIRFIDPDGRAPRDGQRGMYYDYDEKRYRDEDGNDVSLDQAMAYHQQGGKGDPPPKSSLEVYIWDKEGGKDVGHTAIRIGNRVYGYYPSDENANGGFDMKELLSSKGDMKVKDLKGFVNSYQGEIITSYKINLTQKQLDAIETTLNDYIKDPGTYSLLGQNCTTVALSALVINGIQLKAKMAVGAGGRFPVVSYQKIGDNIGSYSPSRLADVLQSSVNQNTVSDIKRFKVVQR